MQRQQERKKHTAKGKQHSKQPKKVARKTRTYRKVNNVCTRRLY